MRCLRRRRTLLAVIEPHLVWQVMSFALGSHSPPSPPTRSRLIIRLIVVRGGEGRSAFGKSLAAARDWDGWWNLSLSKWCSQNVLNANAGSPAFLRTWSHSDSFWFFNFLGWRFAFWVRFPNVKNNWSVDNSILVLFVNKCTTYVLIFFR